MSFHIYKVYGHQDKGLLDTKQYIGIDNQFSTAHDAFQAARRIADIIAAEDESSNIIIGNHITIMNKNHESRTVAIYSEEDWNRGLR